MTRSTDEPRKTNPIKVTPTYEKYLPKTQKRDGKIVPFEFNKIVSAISKAMIETKEGSHDEAAIVAHKVASELLHVAKKYKDSLVEASLLIDDISKEREAGTIYRSSSSHHNVVHEFTYLVAMRDFCNKTLLQMRTNGEVNKKLSKKLEKELSKAMAELASAKYNGLKIESDYYELFLKKLNDQFRD